MPNRSRESQSFSYQETQEAISRSDQLLQKLRTISTMSSDTTRPSLRLERGISTSSQSTSTKSSQRFMARPSSTKPNT